MLVNRAKVSQTTVFERHNMKVIEQRGNEYIIQMAKHELESLIYHLIDVDFDPQKTLIMDGDELGDLTAHLKYNRDQNSGEVNPNFTSRT